jgi:hypothetical protein
MPIQWSISWSGISGLEETGTAGGSEEGVDADRIGCAIPERTQCSGDGGSIPAADSDFGSKKHQQNAVPYDRPRPSN